MEFGVGKCAVLIMRSGKRKLTEGIELLNQEIIKAFREKKNCKFGGY